MESISFPQSSLLLPNPHFSSHWDRGHRRSSPPALSRPWMAMPTSCSPTPPLLASPAASSPSAALRRRAPPTPKSTSSYPSPGRLCRRGTPAPPLARWRDAARRRGRVPSRNLDRLVVAHPQGSLRRISSQLPPHLDSGCNVAVRAYCSRKDDSGLNTLSWRIAISSGDLVVEDCYLLWGLVAREKR